jgi:hypothetical protein
MPTSNARRPWTLYAGALTCLLGAALVVISRLTPDLPVGWSSLVLVLAAAVELSSGASFARRGGAGMDHVFAGVLVMSLGLFLLFASVIDPDAIAAGPFALLFGVFCASNGLFRAMDLLVDGPRAWATEALDVAVTLGLSVALLAGWRLATGSSVGLWVGLELLAGGASIIGAAVAMWRHPELSAYAR